MYGDRNSHVCGTNAQECEAWAIGYLQFYKNPKTAKQFSRTSVPCSALSVPTPTHHLQHLASRLFFTLTLLIGLQCCLGGFQEGFSICCPSFNYFARQPSPSSTHSSQRKLSPHPLSSPYFVGPQGTKGTERNVSLLSLGLHGPDDSSAVHLLFTSSLGGSRAERMQPGAGGIPFLVTAGPFCCSGPREMQMHSLLFQPPGQREQRQLHCLSPKSCQRSPQRGLQR